MKKLNFIVTSVLGLVLLSSCVTNPFSFFSDKNEKGLLKLPTKIDQNDWYPTDESKQGYYYTQSVLYSELGSRFYALKEHAMAQEFFELAIKYDKHNRKALFALGVLTYRNGEYDKAVRYLQSITPKDEKLFPYDIDYYASSRMILSQIPVQGRIISLSRNDYSSFSEGVVVTNRGALHGLQKGMNLTVYRIGNPIRDCESMEVLGVQKTPIAEVTVVELNEKTSVCKAGSIEDGYFIQINDVIEVSFGGLQ